MRRPFRPDRSDRYAHVRARRPGGLELLLLLALAWLVLRPGGPLREDLLSWRAEPAADRARTERWAELSAGRGIGAPVGATLVEFTDYRCPFCGRAQAVVDALLTSDPSVRLVVRHLPIARLHPDAPRLARVAVCAEPLPAFPTVHRALFEAPAEVDAAGLAGLLRAAGVADPAAVLRCAEGEAAAARVRADIALAGALGLRGTPAFVTERETALGALPLERLAGMLGRPVAGPGP